MAENSYKLSHCRDSSGLFQDTMKGGFHFTMAKRRQSRVPQYYYAQPCEGDT